MKKAGAQNEEICYAPCLEDSGMKYGFADG